MPVTGAGIPITTLRMVLIALRACRLSEAVKDPLIIHRTSQIVNRKSQIVNREIPLNAAAFRGMVGLHPELLEVPPPVAAEWCGVTAKKDYGRRAGACRCRNLFPRRPSPPVPSGGPPPFRCERSERRNPLHSWPDLSRCERSERRNPLHSRQDLSRGERSRAVTLWRLYDDDPTL